MWRIAYPNLHIGLLFDWREDDSIIKFEPHLINIKLSLLLQDRYVAWPDLYQKKVPQASYLCTALHRIKTPRRFMQRPAANWV